MPFVDRALKGDPKNRRQTLPAQLTPDQQVTAQLAPSSLPRGRLSPSQFDALFAAAPVPRSVLGGKGGLPKVKRCVKRAGNPLPAHLASTPDISIPNSATRSTLAKTGRQSADMHLFSGNAAGVSAKRQRASLPLPSAVQQDSQTRRHSLAPARSRATTSATPVYIKPDPEDVVDELDLLASPATILAAQQALMREPSPLSADTHAVLDSEHESLASSESGDSSAEVAASQLGGQAATRLELEEEQEQQQDEPELEPSMVNFVHSSPGSIKKGSALASPVENYHPGPTASRHAPERHRTRSPSLRERSARIPVENSKDASDPLSFVRPNTPMRPVDDDVLLMFGLSPSIFQDKKPTRSRSPHVQAQALAVTPLTPDNLRMLQLSKSRTPKKQDAFVVNLPRTETSDATHPAKLNSFVSTVEDFSHQPVIVPVRHPPSSRPTTAAKHQLGTSKGQGAALQIEADSLTQKSLPQQLRSELLSVAQLGDQDTPVSPQRRMRIEFSTVTSPKIVQACTPRASALKQPNSIQRPPSSVARKATKNLCTTPEPRPRTLMDVPLQRSQPEQEVWPRVQKRKRSTPPPSPSMTPSISPQWRRRPRETKLVVEESPQGPVTTSKRLTRPHTAPSPKNVALLDQSAGDSRSASSPVKKNPAVRPTPRPSRLQHLAQTLAKENQDAEPEEEHEEVRTPKQKLSIPPLRSSSARKRLSDDVLLDAMQDDDLLAQHSPARPQASLPKPKAASPRSVRVNVPAASPRTRTVAPRLSTRIDIPLEGNVEDDLDMLDPDPLQTAQTHMQNDSELVKPTVRKERGRPPLKGSQARPVNMPTVSVPSELRGLKTFGLEPESLPRSKRQRRSPGAWWASTDQQPKEEEFEPAISRPGPTRPRVVRSVSATAEPAAPPKAMKLSAATGQQSKRITTSSSVTARTVSFDFADDTSAAPKRPGQARKKPMKEASAKSGTQVSSTNGKQQMSTDKGPRLSKQTSDLDLLQTVTKKPAKGYRRTARARMHAFDDEDSDDL